PSPGHTSDLATTRLPAQPAAAEVTSGIRELALDPDAASDSGHLSGTRVLEMRGAPWGTVAAVAGALLVAALGIAGIVQMVKGPATQTPVETNASPIQDSPAPPSTAESSTADAPAAARPDPVPATTPANPAPEPAIESPPVAIAETP